MYNFVIRMFCNSGNVLPGTHLEFLFQLLQMLFEEARNTWMKRKISVTGLNNEDYYKEYK